MERKLQSTKYHKDSNKRLIKYLDTSKENGINWIPVKVLKNSALVIAIYLSEVLNCQLISCMSSIV